MNGWMDAWMDVWKNGWMHVMYECEPFNFEAALAPSAYISRPMINISTLENYDEVVAYINPSMTAVRQFSDSMMMGSDTSRTSIQNAPSRPESGTRVRAYTMGGVQVGLAGLGPKGDPYFRADYTVREVLNSIHWIRVATEEEIQRDPKKWYRELEWQPLSVVHCCGSAAFPHEFIGQYGTVVTVMAHRYIHGVPDQSPSSPSSVEGHMDIPTYTHTYIHTSKFKYIYMYV